MEQVIVGADGGGSEGVWLGDIRLFDPEQQQVHTGGARPAPEPSCSTYEPQSVFTVGPERLRCCVRVNSWQVRFP